MNKLHPTMLRTGLHQPAASFVCELGGLVLARTASMMGFIPFNATRDSGPVCCLLSGYLSVSGLRSLVLTC